MVNGKVGEYVKVSILKESDGMPFTDLGHGLFIKMALYLVGQIVLVVIRLTMVSLI